MPLFRKSVPQDPLVVSMTGARLGHRIVIVPSNHDDVVMAIAAKAGLTGHVVVVTPDEARRTALSTRALAAGALVETESDVHASADEPAFDIAILDLRESDAAVDATTAAALHGRLRQGGRLVVLMSAPRGGLAALFGGAAAPDTTAQTNALLAAGFRTARLLAVRERMVFIEALKS